MRLKFLKVLMIFGFVLLLAGLFYTQVTKGAYYFKLSEKNRIRLVPIKGPRGTIFDRNGKKLADNKLSLDVAVVPQELKDKEETFIRLSEIVGVPADELLARYSKRYLAPFAPITLVRDVDKKTAIIVEENSVLMPGVMIQPQPVRFYAGVCAHVLGYLSEINRQELEALREYGYKMKDLVGKSGVEKNYDIYLKGEDGGKQLEVDNRGRVVRVLGSKDAKIGKDIYLTIDSDIQETAENGLRGYKGAVIVMNPNNGEILALASSPGFDPNAFLDEDAKKNIGRLFLDSARPMLNRAISGLYPPGSIFKIITATAGLETKAITQYSTFTCNGSYYPGRSGFNCWNRDGHGPQNLVQGIAHSCNVYFFNVGRLAGPDNVTKYASLYGLGKPTGIDLPGEKKGLLPSRAWRRAQKRQTWYEGDTLNFSIGQGDLLVTPIQMLTAVSGVANGGYLVQPYLIKNIAGVESTRMKMRKLPISESTIKSIKTGMIGSVENESGTGKRAKIEGFRFCAKTGTAQSGRGGNHGWFVGFAPVENPKVSFIVFVEHGGSGGQVPADIVRSLIEKMREKKML